jgi:hypothetical protein
MFIFSENFFFKGASILSFTELFELVYELLKELVKVLWLRMKTAKIKAGDSQNKTKETEETPVINF